MRTGTRLLSIAILAVGALAFGAPTSMRAQHTELGCRPPDCYTVQKKKKPDVVPTDQPTSPTTPRTSPSSAPQSPSRQRSPSQSRGEPTRVTEQVLERKLGAEQFQQLRERLDACQAGLGSSNASTCFDNARQREGGPADPTHSTDNPYFEGSRTTTRGVRRATVEETRDLGKTYGSVPGGIVMEGEAPSLGDIGTVRYDKKYNAFIIDDSLAFFVKVPARAIATLCRAFATDDKNLLGVSLGGREIVYGNIDRSSDVAWDLMIADNFLGDIVFAQNTWTRGYRFAGGYEPQADSESGAVAVFFALKDFHFRVENEEIFVDDSNFDVTLIPLSGAHAADGGAVADSDAIARGQVSEKFEANAGHIADNIEYYRRERLVNRLFAYGELAAFIRQLERSGFDLQALAYNVRGTVR